MPHDPLPERHAFRCSCPVQLRFRDLDAMGHVNNAVYFSFMELARGYYMRAIGQVVDGDPRPYTERFPFVIFEIACRYLAPVHLDDAPVVHLRVVELRARSFRFEYLITAGPSGRPVAHGSSVQVAYDYAQGRSAPIPDELRRRIEAFEGHTPSSGHGDA